ncbi:winged helix-turn-helix domain-containing protein [Sphaerisporangium rufum]|nr:winged helix-turn-helix domain-containing protein [Sphaerisporangium rufum]
MSEQNRLIDDPRAMRALAHPARVTILRRLQIDGPATATECARAAAVSPSACSYHLRMLAKYGFVAEAPGRGDARERVWQARQRGWMLAEPDEITPELAEAKNALAGTVVAEMADEVMRYLAGSPRESREWRQAAVFNHMTLRVNADELAELGRRVTEVLEPYLSRNRPGEAAPPDARVVQAVVHLYPRPAAGRAPAGRQDAPKGGRRG